MNVAPKSMKVATTYIRVATTHMKVNESAGMCVTLGLKYLQDWGCEPPKSAMRKSCFFLRGRLFSPSSSRSSGERRW